MKHSVLFKKWVAPIFLCVLLAGCATAYKQINPGMTENEVMQKIGRPHEVQKGAQEEVIWIYRNYPVDSYYYFRDGAVIDKKMAPNAAF